MSSMPRVLASPNEGIEYCASRGGVRTTYRARTYHDRPYNFSPDSEVDVSILIDTLFIGAY